MVSENRKVALTRDSSMQAKSGKSAIQFGDFAERIANSIGQAFYVWDIASDRLEWSEGFLALAGLASDEQRHLTGRGFESLLGSKSSGTRFGIIISNGASAGNGEPVFYQCVYNLQSQSDRNNLDVLPEVWIEDSGCWYPDDSGRPMRAEGSVRVITDRRNREEELRRKSDYDDLTGLPNRRVLEKLIDGAIQTSRNEGTITAFMILSIERLEMINDVYGFESGDFVLQKAGEIIRSKLRTGDAVCRFSGSKFGVILNNCPSAEIYDAGHRMLDALSSEIFAAPGGHVCVNGAIGACFLPKHAENHNEAFQAAFQGLKIGRWDAQNRIGVYCSDPEKIAIYRRQAVFSSEVVAALDDNRIYLSFQPVVHSGGGVAFYEALVRMETPEGEFVLANEFIEIAESLGLIRIVDLRVLDLVLQTLRDYPDAKLSVNISYDTVLDPDWLSNLAIGLASVEKGGERLIVEITESLAATDLVETKRFVENVKALGCRVAIDDFGAGFTSFANLKYLPVDIIKIDGSFGFNIAGNEENQAFVKSLLALAKAFELETVVEWVEDEASALLLKGWNVDYQQGHQFGRALKTPPWERRSASDDNAKIDTDSGTAA